MNLPRRFKLIRNQDVSGVSGCGHVADGVEFPNGQVVLVWRTKLSSLEVCRDVDNLMKIHGHDGATNIEWVDWEEEVG